MRTAAPPSVGVRALVRTRVRLSELAVAVAQSGQPQGVRERARDLIDARSFNDTDARWLVHLHQQLFPESWFIEEVCHDRTGL